MTEPTSSSGGVTPPTGSPVTGIPASDGVTPQMPTLTLEEALKKISELEHAHKNAKETADRHAKAVAKYEQAQKDAELAKLGDLEKANKQLEQMQKQNQTFKQELVNARVREAAVTKGIVDPEMAALALSSKLEFGDDGMPTNLDKALDDLVKAKPYLLTPADSAAQTANQKKPPTTPVNSPGRSQIVEPGILAPGELVRLDSVFQRPGR